MVYMNDFVVGYISGAITMMITAIIVVKARG